jgi:hypothetical protein
MKIRFDPSMNEWIDLSQHEPLVGNWEIVGPGIKLKKTILIFWQKIFN